MPESHEAATQPQGVRSQADAAMWRPESRGGIPRREGQQRRRTSATKLAPGWMCSGRQRANWFGLGRTLVEHTAPGGRATALSEPFPFLYACPQSGDDFDGFSLQFSGKVADEER